MSNVLTNGEIVEKIKSLESEFKFESESKSFVVAIKEEEISETKIDFWISEDDPADETAEFRRLRFIAQKINEKGIKLSAFDEKDQETLLISPSRLNGEMRSERTLEIILEKTKRCIKKHFRDVHLTATS